MGGPIKGNYGLVLVEDVSALVQEPLRARCDPDATTYEQEQRSRKRLQAENKQLRETLAALRAKVFAGHSNAKLRKFFQAIEADNTRPEGKQT